MLVDGDIDILLINDSGIVIRIKTEEIPVQSRITSGVTLMRAADSSVVSIAPITDEDKDISI